jgi:preprotein translocase subunit SecG
VAVLTAILNTLLILTSLFLICLVLIQRGKGGGLAGAFGGVGGSSAFGTKAGDTFTKITVITASIWILMAMLLVVLTNRPSETAWDGEPATSLSREIDPASRPRKKSEAGSEGQSKLPGAESSAPGGSIAEVPALPDSATFPPIPEAPPSSRP